MRESGLWNILPFFTLVRGYKKIFGPYCALCATIMKLGTTFPYFNLNNFIMLECQVVKLSFWNIDLRESDDDNRCVQIHNIGVKDVWIVKICRLAECRIEPNSCDQPFANINTKSMYRKEVSTLLPINIFFSLWPWVPTQKICCALGDPKPWWPQTAYSNPHPHISFFSLFLSCKSDFFI